VPCRVGLINTYSTLNLGDAAILNALARLIGSCTARDADMGRGMGNGSGCEIVATVQDEQPQPVAGVTFRPALEACDRYVSVGGDIFNNSREWLVTRQFLKNLEELRRCPSRTILFGQSIPRSCHGLSLALLCRRLRRLAAVCVRDAESQRRLRRGGVEARLSYDAAFALTPEPAAVPEAERLLRAAGVDPAQAALLSVRAFDSMYVHDNDRFLRRMVELCRLLEGDGLRPVILVQSRAYAADNDMAVAEAIRAEMPGVAVFDPFLEDAGVEHWQLAMGALQSAAVAIGIRYHTSVLALAAGRLPYNLHYSNKGRDLSERLGLPGCDLGSFEPAEQLTAILATAHRHFDAEPIRRHVRESFAECLAATEAGAT
jgi:polysaccharide pyruvyl transferase WcaK-like protein